MASSTTAMATEPLWGSTPIKTFSCAHAPPFQSDPCQYWRARRTFRLRAVLSHTSFESLRTPRAPAGRKPRTSQPILRATGSSRAIPLTGALEA
jgi:hypothetical protein